MDNIYSYSAERSVLGAILLDNTAVEEIELNENDFYNAYYRVIFSSMKELYDKGKTIDITTLYEKAKNFESVNDEEILRCIMDLNGSVFTISGIKEHAEIVRDYSLRRQFKSKIKSFDIGLDESENATLFIEEVQKEMMAMTEGNITSKLSTSSEAAELYLSALKERMTTKKYGIKTGYVNLDTLIKGGLKKGQLVILAARPAMGKTAFALNIGQKVARTDNVLFVSMEMSTEQLMERLYKSEKVLSQTQLMNNVPNYFWRSLEQTKEAVAKLKMFIYDDGEAKIADIRRAARKIKHAHGDLGLIIIDYLQLMRASRRIDSRVQEVSEITRALKILARELDVPIIALSQLSRSVETRQDKKPMLSDLRESGSIEQDADIVMFLYRAAYYEENKDSKVDDTELIIAKHRAGATGTINLRYWKESLLFESANK